MWKKQYETLHFVAVCFTCDYHTAMNKAEAVNRARAFSDDLNGVVGQLPLEKVVAMHIDFFLELRGQGVTWPQIASLMANSNVRRKDGLHVSSDQWRAMVSRVSGSRHFNQTREGKHTGLVKQDQRKALVNDSDVKIRVKENSGAEESDIRTKMILARKHRSKDHA